MPAAKKAKNVEVYLEGVRLSYPYLFKPRVQKNDDGKETKKFQAVFIIPKKDKKQVALVEDAIEEVIEDMWGERPRKLDDSRVCLRDGDDEDGEEFHGAMKLSSSSNRRPQVRDRDKSALVEEDGKPYAGCYVNCIVRIWAQDNDYGKRVNASLEVVQFFKDGEAFGAPGVDADKKLKDFGEDDDDDAPRGRRSSRKSEDDEDDKPARSSRRSSRDDDDDDRPARSTRRSAREEEDDEPRSSRRSSRREEPEDDDDDQPRRRRSSRD